MRSTLSILSLSLLAGVASAQTGPGIIKADSASKVFVSTNFDALKLYVTGATRKWISQVSMNQILGDGPGFWTTCLTVNGLASQYGNTANSQTAGFVLMGRYNAKEANPKKAFVPNKFANAMNKVAGGNFGLMIGGTRGQYAIVDWNDGVYFSKRTTHLRPFPAPVKITGISNTYVDPSVATFDINPNKAGDETVVFWVSTYGTAPNSFSRILMSELDHSKFSTGTVQLVGKPVVVADITRGTSGTIQVHSPTPVLDRAGKVHGLMVAERVGNDSNMFFKGDLTFAKGHEQQLFLNGTAWNNNGAVPGGTLMYADSEATRTPFYLAIGQSGVAWLAGGQVRVGGSGSVVGAVADVNPGPNVTVILMSIAVGPALPIPGFTGKFALNLAAVSTLGAMTHPDASERGTFPVTIPNNNAFKGVSLALQGLSIDQGASTQLTFTNTAWLNIK